MIIFIPGFSAVFAGIGILNVHKRQNSDRNKPLNKGVERKMVSNLMLENRTTTLLSNDRHS
jgi:hypothetical protein